MDLFQALRKYKHRLDESVLLSYEEHDKFIYINENDPDLQKWRIALPEPPDWDKIDGFGKHAMEQVFVREEIPVRLLSLERSVIRRIESRRRANDTDPAIEKKKYEETWNELKKLKKEYKEEIEWIKRQWWHQNFGKWIFIKGKPFYIQKWHWFYLNYFQMEDLGLPDFRVRDWKWYHAQEYAATTTEAVELDENGNTILLSDGTLKMKDVGVRTLFGTNNLKGRRVGETSKTEDVSYCVSISKNDANCGIQANSENTASDIYKEKLLYAYNRMPFFFKPIMKDFHTGSGLHFDGQYGTDGLNSHIVPASTAKKEFFDQKRLDFYHGDEIGKTKLEDVVERHGVVKRCCSEGDVIKGFMIYTSTAEDMDSDAGIKFEELSMNSMFEQRLFNGQTTSGLVNVYFPIYESYKGFIDRFGYPIINTPEDYQVQDMDRIEYDEDGKIMGAKAYLESVEKDLAERGDIKALAQFQRQHPTSFRKCFALALAGTQFNTQILQETISELKFNYKPRIGKFVWTGQRFNSPVTFVDDPNGKWNVSSVLPDNICSKVGKDTDGTKFPRLDGGFIIGSDSYRYSETDSSRKSDGGIAVYQMHDERIDPEGKADQDFITERFVADYLGREESRDLFAEEVLKAAIYYNGLAYPEANLSIEQEFFVNNGYRGYLLFDVDPETGKKKSNSGFNSAGPSIKQKLFSHVDTWINLHGRKCKHQRILEDYLGIRDPKFMKDYDLFVASAACLIGRMSRYVKYMRRFSDNGGVDVSKFWNL